MKLAHSIKLLVVIAALVIAMQSRARAQFGINPAPGFGIGPVPGLPWLHEGTVLTLTQHAAIVPGNPVTWKQDDFGDWIDPRTGLSYDKYENYGTSDTTLGEASVLCIDGNSVILKRENFGLEQKLGFSDPVRLGPLPALVDDVTSNSYWKSPAVLARQASDYSRGILVTRVSWNYGGQKVDAVRIQITQTDLYQVEIYDLKTGLCLHVASSYIQNGDTHISRCDLIHTRDMNVPWQNEPMPAALQTVTSMRFSGRIVNTGSLRGGGPTAAVVHFAIKARGTRWIAFDRSATLNGLMAQVPAVIYGPNEFCGLWIGPKAASSFKVGQELDNDPDTKMKTVVTKIKGNKIEITQSNPSSGTACVYDLTTGLQVAYAEVDNSSKNAETLDQETMQ